MTSAQGAQAQVPPAGRAAAAGVLAAAVALAAAEFLAGLLPGGRSPFVATGDAVIRLAPAGLVDVAVAVLGSANRFVLVVVMGAVVAAAGGLLGRWAARRWWVAPAAFGLFALLAVAAGLADPLVPTSSALLAPLAGAGAGCATLWWLTSRLAARSPRPLSGVDDAVRSRRAFLTWAASAAGGAFGLGIAGQLLQRRSAADAARRGVALPRAAQPLPPPPPAAALEVDGISPLITPVERFYRIDTALTVPRIDPRQHRIRVTGMVDRPLELGYGELLDLADTEVDVLLACVSNEVGGSLVGNARWLGAPLAGLLDRAGVRPEATQVVGRAVDGWTAGFPVQAALDGRPALVAVGMNGQPLPDRHGFPARLVIAGLYGYVSDTKWLSEIELTTFDAYDAYWVRRGWARRAPIKTQSRIDVPRTGSPVTPGTVTVAGVAWAGERAVSAVEVAIDRQWRPAELAAELSSTSWRQWRYRWDAEPGEHLVQVRATDGDGHTQESERRPPMPDGATGYHTIRVVVDDG